MFAALLANATHHTAARFANADVGKHHSAVALKVFATYWPQWHATPLNDYWFGKGYTDWDLLCLYKKAHGDEMMNPLPPPKGLGWYDLNDKSVRRRQALLAKEYGVHGLHTTTIGSRATRAGGALSRGKMVRRGVPIWMIL